MPLSSVQSSLFDALFAPWERHDAPGLACGLVQQGRLVYARGYGLANLEYGVPLSPSSVFHVASLSKQITAMLILQLAREGKVSLEDDLHDYFPDLPPSDAVLTLQHCLWHTSGLRDQWELIYLAGWRDGDLVTTDDIVHLLSRQRASNFPAGTAFCYCNSGYTLLGRVIEQVTGVSLRTYAQQQVFAPLGMLQTSFQDDHTRPVGGRVIAYAPHPDGNFHANMPMFDTIGATGLLTTIEDLARWIAYLETLYASGSPLLKQMLTAGKLANGQPIPYGAGLFLGHSQGLQTVSHTGSDYGYRASMLWLPQRQEAILLLSNLATLPLRLLSQQIMDVLLETAFHVFPEFPGALDQRAPARTVASSNSEPLAELAGLYHHAATEAVRRYAVEGDQLKLVYGPGTHLVPEGPGHFRIAKTLLTVRFGSDRTGRWVEEQDAEGLIMRYEAVLEEHLTEEQLAAYIGIYRSEEVETSYRIVLQNHQLMLLHEKFPPRVLHPTILDGFWMEEDIRLRFRRQPDQVMGFATWTHRVRKVFFEKDALCQNPM